MKSDRTLTTPERSRLDAPPVTLSKQHTGGALIPVAGHLNALLAKVKPA